MKLKEKQRRSILYSNIGRGGHRRCICSRGGCGIIRSGSGCRRRSGGRWRRDNRRRRSGRSRSRLRWGCHNINRRWIDSYCCGCYSWGRTNWSSRFRGSSFGSRSSSCSNSRGRKQSCALGRRRLRCVFAPDASYLRGSHGLPAAACAAVASSVGLAKGAGVLRAVAALVGGAAPAPAVLLAEAQTLAPRCLRAAGLGATHPTAVADAVPSGSVGKLGAPGLGAAAAAAVLRATLGFVPCSSNATRLFAPDPNKDTRNKSLR